MSEMSVEEKLASMLEPGKVTDDYKLGKELGSCVCYACAHVVSQQSEQLSEKRLDIDCCF